jgi:hypothetical protein
MAFKNFRKCKLFYNPGNRIEMMLFFGLDNNETRNPIRDRNFAKEIT